MKIFDSKRISKKAEKGLTTIHHFAIIIKVTNTFAGVVQWQNPSLPSWSCGFDSHHPLHEAHYELLLLAVCAPVAQLDRATAF